MSLSTKTSHSYIRNWFFKTTIEWSHVGVFIIFVSILKPSFFEISIESKHLAPAAWPAREWTGALKRLKYIHHESCPSLSLSFRLRDRGHKYHLSIFQIHNEQLECYTSTLHTKTTPSPSDGSAYQISSHLYTESWFFKISTKSKHF